MRQAMQAYQETVWLASMANSSNNPNIARQAYDTSQFAVNRANNVATGRLPNTYTPYDSNGNPYSYFNSSRQAGKTPSPDAPRVEDVSGDATYYCDREDTSSASALITGAASPSNWTFGIGADFAAAYGIRISGGAQLVFDSKGNVGIMYYGGFGGGTPSASASLTATITSAEDIYALSGLGFSAGASGLIPAPLDMVGAEVTVGKGYMGGTLSVGIAVPLPEAHGEATYSKVIEITDTLKLIGVYDELYSNAKKYVEGYYESV